MPARTPHSGQANCFESPRRSYPQFRQLVVVNRGVRRRRNTPKSTGTLMKKPSRGAMTSIEMSVGVKIRSLLMRT